MNIDRITDWPARPTAGPGWLQESPTLGLHEISAGKRWKTVEPAPETAALRRINSPKSARPLMPRWRGDRLALPSLFRPVSCAATGAPMGRRPSPRPPAPSNGPEHGRTGPVGNSSRPPHAQRWADRTFPETVSVLMVSDSWPA